MNGEFNNYCSHYYRLTVLLAKREERLKNLLINAPLYVGQTTLDELDDIISYNRKVQRVKKKTEGTANDIREAERNILLLMNYFEIPPGTVLTGTVPEELEYKIWADENDKLYIVKTKTIDPIPDPPNVVTIRLGPPIEKAGDDDDDD